MSVGIYKLIFNNTDKVYIGQSLNIEYRYIRHVYLMNRRTTSAKLQYAFDTYGEPKYAICIQCSENKLDELEEFYIKKYNSVDNGFNTCKTSGFKTCIVGELHHNSVYSNDEIVCVLELLVDPSVIPFKTISEITKVSISVIAGIASLQQHRWLKDNYTEKYTLLQNMYSSNTRRQFTKTGVKVKAYTIISEDGRIEEITNGSKFAKEKGLDKGALSRLCKGTQLYHKGWRLYTAKIDPSGS